MVFCKTLFLYGSQADKEMAMLKLEDQPQVKRIDPSADMSHLRILLSPALSECELISLLADTGISGFRLDRS